MADYSKAMKPLQTASEVETLRLLLEVHEATAVAQAELAERALDVAMQAAAAREQQAAQMHEVIEASSECVMVMNRDWVIEYMNMQATRVISAGLGHAGMRLDEVFPELGTTSFWERFAAVMKSRTGVVFEDFYRPLERWYAMNVAPVGQGIAIFFRDVTDRRRQDAMLQRTEKLAAVGRLASSISHEINNPLESVVNLLYLIEHSESAGAEMRTYAALATSELQRVSHIVTHTLKFHRQSARALKCRMSEVLRSVLSLHQGRLATLRVEVLEQYVDEDWILCFAGDMRQVFANLVGNALDALRGEGKLWLRTRVSRDWKTGMKGVRVMIADTGGGMTEETKHRLFEAFFTTKLTTGTGLGLWVSEEIIRNHRGTIRVRSSDKPEKSGTVFSVFFPRDETLAQIYEG